MKRNVVALIAVDEDVVSERNVDGPIEFLEKEIDRHIDGGEVIDSFIADDDEDDEQAAYLNYLAEWIFDHRGEEYKGMSPAGYNEWVSTEKIFSGKKTLKVVLCKPNEEAVITKIDGSLEGMQKVVNGFIEMVWLKDGVVAICNEEGKLNGLDLNRALFNEEHELVDIIAGTFFVVAAPDDSDSFASLSDKQAEECLELFRYPQTFFNVTDENGAAKIEARTLL